jgi:hypothetical protein
MTGPRPARPRPRDATRAHGARRPATPRSAGQGARVRRMAARSVAPDHRSTFVRNHRPPAPASSPGRPAGMVAGLGRGPFRSYAFPGRCAAGRE